jgi:hypothetical protein
MSKMTGGQTYQTNSHVLRREIEEQRKQRKLAEGTMNYTARRNVINEFAPDKVRNFAALEIANKHTKFEIERPSLMQGQINRRDPFNTIVHTHVNPMHVKDQPGPQDYQPQHRGVMSVKDPHLQHSSFASKSPQQLRLQRSHTNDTIFAAPAVTHDGVPLRKQQAVLFGETKRDTSMVQYHRLDEFDDEMHKITQARKQRLQKKVIPEPKKQFVDPGLFGPIKDERCVPLQRRLDSFSSHDLPFFSLASLLLAQLRALIMRTVRCCVSHFVRSLICRVPLTQVPGDGDPRADDAAWARFL